jgi:replicative DNA helicase Mcm
MTDTELTARHYKQIIIALCYQIEKLVELLKKQRDLLENEPSPDLGVLHGKPPGEVLKLKLFMEIYNALSGQDRDDVSEETFINELVKTGKFSEEDARIYIRKAMMNGQIFERKAGFYAKA